MGELSPKLGALHVLKVVGPLIAEWILDDHTGTIDGWTILLMGTTGSGKSAFIEKIVNDKSLGIAKDQLEGCTQHPTGYRVANLMFYGRPIYIVDTPGFSDPRIPESRILREVQQWMSAHKVKFVERLLYFDSIMDPRMSGSRMNAQNILKAITGQESRHRVHVITTMWDRLWNVPQRKRANERFNQLLGVHWKDFAGKSSGISGTLRSQAMLKFSNTQESALSILDECLGISSGSFFHFEEHLNARIQETGYGELLRRRLVERQLTLQRRIKLIVEDLNNEDTQANNDLARILHEHKREAETDLWAVDHELNLYCIQDVPMPHSDLHHPIRHMRSRSFWELPAARAHRSRIHSRLGAT